jgi:hypothetical protein
MFPYLPKTKNPVIAGVSVIVLYTSTALANGPLPFADGTYVTDPALCTLTQQKMLDIYGDSIGAMVVNIEGRSLDNGYEMYCKISKTSVTKKTIRFRAECDAEGETQRVNETWTRIDARSFRSRNRVFYWCGNLIR